MGRLQLLGLIGFSCVDSFLYFFYYVAFDFFVFYDIVFFLRFSAEEGDSPVSSRYKEKEQSRKGGSVNA